jgi:hypothetical protein
VATIQLFDATTNQQTVLAVGGLWLRRDAAGVQHVGATFFSHFGCQIKPFLTALFFFFYLPKPCMYALYHPAIFWVFTNLFCDLKKCLEKCSTPSEHFCMTKMFKHFSDHFFPFNWVYWIPTYVRQLPLPLGR